MASQYSIDIHSVEINGYNTWDEWHLIPESRPIIEMPQRRTQIVDIPTIDGVIDISESLTGYPVFQNRTGSLSFYVMHEYYTNGMTWKDMHNRIVTHLHGRKLRMRLMDDPDFYYEGYFSMDSWTTDADPGHSRVKISYDLHPYKRKLVETTISVPVSGTRDVALSTLQPANPTMRASVTAGESITCTGPTYGGANKTVTLTATDTTYNDIFATEFINDGILTFNGYGTVDIRYTEGRL